MQEELREFKAKDYSHKAGSALARFARGGLPPYVVEFHRLSHPLDKETLDLC